MQLALLIIFFFSGLSSLIYQITWQRLMTVYYGVGSTSIALIVSIYMLGLGLGALYGGRLAEKRKDTVGLYFWIELGIGGFGLLSFPLILAIGQFTAGSPYILAALFEAVFLIFPTLLMGMSLPVLIKIFTRVVPDLSKSVSRLYFVNALGGAAGCLFGSYYLISFLGINNAIIAAATINLVLAASILFLPKSAAKEVVQQEPSTMPVVTGPIANYAPALVFITGFLAIGYELVWFRVIGVLVKASPYAFATVLAVYLLGISLGSLIMGKVIHRLSIARRIFLFFALQVMVALIIAVIFIGYYYLTVDTLLRFWTQVSFDQQLHPPVYLLLEQFRSKNLAEFIMHAFGLGTVLIWPVYFLLVPTMLMGASFPLIVGLVFKKNDGVARVTGKVYFFNVMGNVFGGLVTGLFLLPVLGSELTIILFVLVGLLFALPVLFERRSWKACVCFALIAVAVIYFLPKRGELYRAIHPQWAGFKQYFREGRDGVVMTYVNDKGVVHNYINGDVHGGRPAYSFYVQVLEAAGSSKTMENILVIGYGTGSITEGVLRVPGVKKVTVVELNRTLMRNLEQIPLFQELMKDDRLEFVIDDGRRFLQSHPGVYDVVFMSPLRATTAYSNNIYSQQFFELVSSHLSENGLFILWTDALDVTYRTLETVFPHSRLHLGHMEGFYLASHKRIVTYRETNDLRPWIYSFDPVTQERIFAASHSIQVIPSYLLRNYTHNYPPAQDWLPLSEYYLGIWFANRK